MWQATEKGCLYIRLSKIQENTSDQYLNCVVFLMERSEILSYLYSMVKGQFRSTGYFRHNELVESILQTINRASEH